MKCEDIRVLLAAYRRSEWTLDEQRAVSKHLAGCAECRRWEVAARGVGEHLRQLPTITPPASLRERVFAAIREEERASQSAASATPMPTTAKKTVTTPISIAAARGAAANVLRPVRIVPPPTERVGEVAIGQMHIPHVWLGRKTAIATVAALFALIFLAKLLPYTTTQIPRIVTGNNSNPACLSQYCQQGNTSVLTADPTYPQVQSVVADSTEAVYVGKSATGQEMLFVSDIATKKPVALLDTPVNGQLTVVALTPKLLIWTIGTTDDSKSNWSIDALPLVKGKVQSDVTQIITLAARGTYLQDGNSPILAVNAFWVHQQSVLLTVTTQSLASELVRADLADNGIAFTETAIAQAASNHAFADPYLDDSAMYWVDASVGANATSQHVIWQESLQLGAAATPVTTATTNAAGPITAQQGIAWIQEVTTLAPTNSIVDATSPTLTIKSQQGSGGNAVQVGSIPTTSTNISRGDGYYFWIDPTGKAYIYSPSQNAPENLAVIPGTATIVGLSASAIAWVVPAEHANSTVVNTITVLPLG